MPFGISSAAEVMPKRNEETFGDIGDVHMVADDMIIASETESAHDATLLKVMTRAQEKGAKFNKKKIQFKVAEVNYLGNIITLEGIKADPKKIAAIANMPTPHDRQSLLRLLGMVKYLSAYIPHESIITAPMRALLRKDVAWQWEHEHNTALEQVKAALASAPVLQFYCVKKAVTLQADASQSGLGACLLQEGKPIAYASRALTNAERNYAQIEKELLAICFACTKFHQYIYGKECSVQTDHRPLEAIFRKPMNQTSPRLQRMLLKLQRYQLNVGYIPGKLMYVADTLSRAHPPQGKYQDDEDFDDKLEIMVQSMLSNIPIKAMDWKKIQQATEDDPIFQGLKSMIINGWPDHKSSLPSELQPYWQVKDDLYIANEVVLYNEHIVIPAELQTKALALLHESHQGIEKSKMRAKSTMFWPGIGQDIEDSVEKCPICLTHRNQQQKEPLLPHPVPERPWQKVGSDILTFQNVDYLLVVDYYSKYPEIIKIEDKSAGTIIAKMKAIFARHGIPEELMSDNMPYASKEFHQFASEWNIKLTTSSPLYPQSNGQSERFVQTVKQMLKKVKEEGKDFYIALLEYRTTPISGSEYSPSQMLMSRMLHSKLPITPTALQPRVVDARKALITRQEKQKVYFDRNAKPLSTLTPGDPVRIQNGSRWEPAVVMAEDPNPRSFIVRKGDKQYRRNRKHLLKTKDSQTLPPPSPPREPREEKEEEMPQTEGQQSILTPPTASRNGRAIRRPQKYKDYVMTVQI